MRPRDVPLTHRTFLRLILLRLTRRPVPLNPVPTRQFDPASLPLDVLDPSSSSSSSSSAPVDAEPAIAHMRGSTLRNHLIPLTASLPESHKPHPLALLPELDARGYAAEVLSASAGLVHVLMLLRWARVSWRAWRALERRIQLPAYSDTVSKSP
jgi:peroxin-16